MTKPSTSARRPDRPFRGFLWGIEGSLLGSRYAHFQEAPDRLASQISGAHINQRDGVAIWREEPEWEHRTVVRPGVVTIGDAGMIGHTGRDTEQNVNAQAIVNIIDSSGRPLFFPFKKNWNLRSSLKHLSLLFAARREGPRGKVALLGSSSCSFYHFMTEVVGDWWYLKQMGYYERDFSTVVVHGHRHEWQEELLDMLGIPLGKRRYHFEVKERHIDLVLPYRTKGDAVSVPSWMCEALWSELGKRIVNRAGTRKIYLSRKGAGRRRLRNEPDLTGQLKRMGFELWQMEGLRISEQQELFASARVVIAEHGAGLTNLVWCPANATVVDIHPVAPGMPCFKILAELRGVRYVPIFVAQGEGMQRDDWSISEKAIDGVLGAVGEALDSVEAARR